MKNKTIGFIGGGRITNIFLQAFKNENVSFSKIVIFDPNTECLQKLQNNYSLIECESADIEVASTCDFVILAVHPPIILDILTEIRSFLKQDAIVVSLAPKITIKKMVQVLNGFENIARVNPSAPGIVNQGINPVTFSNTLSENQKKIFLTC